MEGLRASLAVLFCLVGTAVCGDPIELTSVSFGNRPELLDRESEPMPVDAIGLPLGGGEGYGAWVTRPSDVIESEAELLARLATAEPGQVLYIDDDAVIDLSGRWELEIPAGVTLASGRGRDGSAGALLFTSSMERKALLEVVGSGVRVTGLRLQGPTTEIDEAGCGDRDATGIATAGSGDEWRFEIDNCELWAWPSAAVSISGAAQANVHHNHIHHNRRIERSSGCRAYGLGYGVEVTRSSATIEANLFNDNRHDIKNTGVPVSSYFARYNLSVEGLIGHSFDVHGCIDNPEAAYCRDNPEFAGDQIEISRNTFLDAHHAAVIIRGVPRVGAWVSFNRFVHSPGAAVKQLNYEGNMQTAYNDYAVVPESAWFIIGGGRGSEYWKFRRFASEGVGDVGYGDFDGDGRVDAFMADGERWQIARAAREGWLVLNDRPERLDQLRFGDFDGDGVTDVFHATGSRWLVSYGGYHDWEKLADSRLPSTELAFADFDGDGTTDVFHATGSEWLVSYKGRSALRKLNGSNSLLRDLRFGDFDADGQADVFTATDREWKVSLGGRSDWLVLNPVATPLAALRLCDFDGNSKSDVLYLQGDRAQIAYDGVRGLEPFAAALAGVQDLAAADFTGDGKCDLLAKRRPR